MIISLVELPMPGSVSPHTAFFSMDTSNELMGVLVKASWSTFLIADGSALIRSLAHGHAPLDR